MADATAKRAPFIKHHPKTCTGCGLCNLMCSLYHEGSRDSGSPGANWWEIALPPISPSMCASNA